MVWGREARRLAKAEAVSLWMVEAALEKVAAQPVRAGMKRAIAGAAARLDAAAVSGRREALCCCSACSALQYHVGGAKVSLRAS